MVSESWPLVSVVLPARNEGTQIGKCLDAVLAQDYPEDRFEVVVADGSSDDGSRAILDEYARRDPRLRILENPHRIVPCALNIGIRAARGEIIARVDGHTFLARDYLRRGVEALRRTAADNVGGRMDPIGGGLFGDAVARAMCSRFGIGAQFHFATREREVDTVYLGMWPRATFERVGLFDEELVRNQDDELNYRLRKAGGRVVLIPDMRSRYQNRTNAWKLARQFYEYGTWKVRVLQKHPRQMSWRHFVPPAFVSALLFALASIGTLPYAGQATVLLLGAYGLCVVPAGVWTAAREGLVACLATVLAFAVIHLAWGLGFVTGLIRFGHRWRGSESTPPALVVGEAAVPPGAGGPAAGCV
jgi:glycosyltransferase involved in cell wall biosynthesis